MQIVNVYQLAVNRHFAFKLTKPSIGVSLVKPMARGGEIELIFAHFVAFLANTVYVYALPIWLEFGKG
jgi:hypothetical protein